MAAGHEPACLVNHDRLQAFVKAVEDAPASPDTLRWRQHVQGCQTCRANLDRWLTDEDLLFTKQTTQAAMDPLPDELRSTWIGAFSAGPTAESSPPPKQLSTYAILNEIGRGGMAVVYRAHDPRLDRDVAIKMLAPPQLSTSLRARFVLEGRAMAALVDDGIVPIFEVIDDPDRPAIVMPIMEGGSLATRIAARDYPPRQAATWVRQVAGALATVHVHGFVHRDVKPGNVLLDRMGRARLADFGLVRSRIDFQITAANTVAGTPEYLPPETISDPESPATAQGDIYQCGVLLYHLLIGRPPFEGNLGALLQKIASPAFPSLRRQGIAISKDLERICLKAMAHVPVDRYATAHDLAMDLDRFLEGREVLARPIPPWIRLGRRVARRPWMHAAAAALGALSLAAGWYGWFHARRAGELSVAVRQAQGNQKAAEIERDFDRGQVIQVIASGAVVPDPNPTAEATAKQFLTLLASSIQTGLDASIARREPSARIASQALALAYLRSNTRDYDRVPQAAAMAIAQFELALKEQPRDASLMAQGCAARRLQVRALLELHRLEESAVALEALGREIERWSSLSAGEPMIEMERLGHKVMAARHIRDQPGHAELIDQAYQRWSNITGTDADVLLRHPSGKAIAEVLQQELIYLGDNQRAEQVQP